jgi:hypothetical protein
MNLHLLFLAVTFKSSSMQIAFEAPVFLYSVHVATQQTIVIRAEQ